MVLESLVIRHFCHGCKTRCKTRVKFVNRNRSVLIHLLLVKFSQSVCGLLVGFLYVVNKLFVRCR